MKKFAIMSLAVAMLAGVAVASSLSVPWFLDNDEGFIVAGYITLKNTTNAPIDIALIYTEQYGDDATPVDNTYILDAATAVGFRPVVSQPDEGFGINVPNKAMDKPTTSANALDAGHTVTDNFFGSLTIQWVGEPTDVVGRYYQLGAGFTDDVAMAYLLPPGK